MTQRKRAKKHEAKRKSLVTLRLTDEERFDLEKRAAGAGLSLSDYIRNQSFQRKPVAVSSPAIPLDVVFQLRKLGVNLNQIAHALNKGLDAPPELRRLCRSIDDYLTETLANDPSPRARR